MDATDLRIVRALSRGREFVNMRPGARVSVRGVARELRLPEASVRRRIDKMRSGGLLSRMTVYVNPSLLGLTYGVYGFNVPASVSKHEVVERIRLVDGVTGIDSYHGRYGFLTFLFEEEEDRRRKLALFRNIAHAEDELADVIPFPPCNVSLSRLEWTMISRLAGEELISASRLASETGVSVHSVNRELRKLTDANAIFTLPMISTKELQGGIAAALLVSFSPPSLRPGATAELLRLMGDMIAQQLDMTATTAYALFLPNTLTASELSERIGQIEGVAKARIEFLDRHFPQPEVSARYVRKRLALLDEVWKGKSRMRARPRAPRRTSSSR